MFIFIILIILIVIFFLIAASKIEKKNLQSEYIHADTLKKQEELEQRISTFEEEKQEFLQRKKDLEREADYLKSKEYLKESLSKDIAQLYAEKDHITETLNNLDKQYTDYYTQSLIPLNLEETTSSEVKNKLSLLKNKEKRTKLVAFQASFKNPKDANRIERLILLPFNSEVNGILNNLTLANIEQSRNKIISIFEKLNNTFSHEYVQLTEAAINLKLEELELHYQYIVKKNAEKEQQKAIREQMREEEKARREFEKEQLKIEREEKQFNNQLNKLLKYLNTSTNDVQIQFYKEQIAELKDKLDELELKKKDLTDRQLNTRAGFVYIISNIGSFGENVYKIGMTKRLYPMDRINELSSASVPFPFDVHAMIFSEDAPALESKLHQVFKDKSINKVNFRKEFFEVSLQEIKNEVEQNYNGVFEFTDVAKAEEYRRSLEL
ncbi:DUF4041 domain-containing protein [Leuconostoc lactis]|uniref:DUF4041 domain-containing protein n=1 Tax=Leuconostoc lactis TaxID=1246 RepID=UPI0028A29820|nr:DUF4041 domain-containing protein [Leuconostoc lactis]